MKTLGILLKRIGNLLILLGILESIASLVSMVYGEWHSAAGLVISAVTTAGAGFGLTRIFRTSEEPQNKHAIIATALGWLIIGILGGLPFFICSWITPLHVMHLYIPPDATYSESSLIYFKNPLHCLFESMSAFTTTGLTMAVHEPSIGHGLLFYRSLSQWVGGAGFIVMVLAIFKRIPGQSAIALYGSETKGRKLKTTVIETTRIVWVVYVIITAFSAVYLIIGTRLILPGYPIGKNIFDSINHAMTGQSTGGFSVLDDSIASYNSVQMEMLYLLPMILGSLSAAFYFRLVFKGEISLLWRDMQTRALFVAFIIGSVVLTVLLINSDKVSAPAREGIFQFISALSTTGWQTSDIGSWDNLSVLFIVGSAMFIGGAAGATVGEIKIIRAILIAKGLKWQVKKVFFSERTILTAKFDGKTLLPDDMIKELAQSAIFAITFLLMIFGGALVTSFYTDPLYFSLSDALFESASAQGTVGLSSGITDPFMSPVVEVVYIFQMWSGRLEVIPVFALIRALIWGIDPRIF